MTNILTFKTPDKPDFSKIAGEMLIATRRLEEQIKILDRNCECCVVRAADGAEELIEQLAAMQADVKRMAEPFRKTPEQLAAEERELERAFE